MPVLVTVNETVLGPLFAGREVACASGDTDTASISLYLASTYAVPRLSDTCADTVLSPGWIVTVKSPDWKSEHKGLEPGIVLPIVPPLNHTVPQESKNPPLLQNST